jgi:putative endonuclease
MKRAFGLRGETLAAAHLKAQGYSIITTNWRCSAGELDIVAQDGDTLVFVEVRSRHTGSCIWIVMD